MGCWSGSRLEKLRKDDDLRLTHVQSNNGWYLYWVDIKLFPRGIYSPVFSIIN
jgi:hypothetical protein